MAKRRKGKARATKIGGAKQDKLFARRGVEGTR
jgi:hypothetical protein